MNPRMERSSLSREIDADLASMAHLTGDAARPLLTHLQSILISLSRVERRVGEYILEDRQRVLSSSIDDIHHGSGASAGAISAFCRVVGAKGFTNLKIRMARELAQVRLVQSPRERIEPVSPCVFESVLQFHARSLGDLVHLNSQETLEEVSRIIQMARRVEFFSIGMSYPVAYTACNMLRLIGVPAAIQSDSHLQVIAARQLNEGDVAFGISCSGCTHETVQCLKIARDYQPTTLCITNCQMSPVTGNSDLVLYATPSEVDELGAPLASRVTELALLDALFVSIARCQKQKVVRHLQSFGENLLRYRRNALKSRTKVSPVSSQATLLQPLSYRRRGERKAKVLVDRLV